MRHAGCEGLSCNQCGDGTSDRDWKSNPSIKHSWNDHLAEVEERKQLAELFLWVHYNWPEICSCSDCEDMRQYVRNISHYSSTPL